MTTNLEELRDRYTHCEPPLLTPPALQCFTEQLSHVRKGCLSYSGPATVLNCKHAEISVQGTREGVHSHYNREAGVGASAA
ncbi:hypothetical protein HDU93_005960, partial [Gonapodya sp. JEL0774]